MTRGSPRSGRGPLSFDHLAGGGGSVEAAGGGGDAAPAIRSRSWFCRSSAAAMRSNRSFVSPWPFFSWLKIAESFTPMRMV
jgi:hypothetical protein